MTLVRLRALRDEIFGPCTVIGKCYSAEIQSAGACGISSAASMKRMKGVFSKMNLKLENKLIITCWSKLRVNLAFAWMLLRSGKTDMAGCPLPSLG
jgi:hypothetical protein